MADWPDISGRLEADGAHVLPIRVYYEDTDFSGAVYHANYLKFCERGRSDFLRLKGIHHHEIAAGPAGGFGGGFVVRAMACDFLKPARIDELLHVHTRLIEAQGARFELSQVISRAGETLFTARVTVALVDGQARPRRMPPAMRARMGGPNGAD